MKMKIINILCIPLLLMYAKESLAKNEQPSKVELSKSELHTVFRNCEELGSKFLKFQNDSMSITLNRMHQISLYKSLVNELNRNNTGLQRAINTQLHMLVAQTKEVAQVRLELQNSTRLQCELRDTLEATTAKLNASEQTVDTLTQQLAQTQRELSEARAKLKDLNSEATTLKQDLLEQMDRANSLEIQTEINAAALGRSKESIEKLTEKSNKTDKLNAELTKQVNDFKDQTKADAEKIKHLNSIISDFANCCQAKSCTAFGDSSNVNVIQVSGVEEPFQVLCNSQLAGPGWTVIQRRLNGSVDFYRNWSEYKKGFGDLNSEFFIGLEKLHHMTAAEPQQLFIQLEDFDGDRRFIKYDSFKVGSEQEDYALQLLGNDTGDLENAMRLSLGQKFTTPDRDNDKELSVNCATYFHGPWWHNKCGLSNLNGRYQIADEQFESPFKGIFWNDADWHGHEYSFKTAIMMIRPKSS